MERHNGFLSAKMSDKGAFYLPICIICTQNRPYQKKPGLDLEKGEVKIGGRNISNLRYARDNILLAEAMI